MPPEPARDAFASDQKYRLSGQIEPFPAANIAARNHVVDSHHVRTGFCKLLAIAIVRTARDLGLLGPDDPAHWKGALLPAVRANQRNLLGLFFLVVKSFFVHSVSLWSPLVTTNSQLDHPFPRTASPHLSNEEANTRER